MEVINKKGLHNLLSEQLPEKNSPVNPVVKPPQRVNKPRQTTTEPIKTVDNKIDPQIKEKLENYLSVIRFFSPNGVRINLRLTDELYYDILKYFYGLKDSEPNITLLQSLISFLIESEKYSISSFDVPQGYQSQIEMLIQENVIGLTSGLKNIILEQAKRVGYVVTGGKIRKPSSQGTKQPSTAGQPTGPLLPPKTSTVQTPEIKKPSEIKLKPEERKMIPQNTTTQLLSDNKNIQKIKYYSDLIKTTDKPNYKLCDNLFDNYESEIKLLKKQIEQGLVNPPKGDEPILGEIKSKIKWCYTSSQEKWRFKFKFSQLSSLRDDKIKNSKGEEIDNPFKVNI
jgi:hypothetical protein